MVTREKPELFNFFTYEYQAKLIQDAQRLDLSYEGALTQYWEIFTAHLIECIETADPEVRSTQTYMNMKRIIDNDLPTNADRITVSGKASNISLISEMFLLIRQAYHCWTSSDLSIAIRILNYILTKKINVSSIGEFPLNNNWKLYRGRVSSKALDKIDMFHIPFTQAYKIRNQRFSITGQPLLYLADSISGVLNELSIHKADECDKLFVVQYRLNLKGNTSTESRNCMFDMTISDEYFQRESQNFDEFSRYFCKFILSCACSFPNIRGRGNYYFVEEYVIPQLVTQLLAKTNFIGIRYNTINCNGINAREQKNSNYVNYVFFTKRKETVDAIDVDLRRSFVISSPITISMLGIYDLQNHYSLEMISDLLTKYLDQIGEFDSVLHKIDSSTHYNRYKQEKHDFFSDSKYPSIKIESGDTDK